MCIVTPSDGAVARRLVRTFVDLARTDSPSFHEGAMADVVEARLADLGFATSRDDTTDKTGSDTGNLFGHLPGLEHLPTVAFAAHLDTVEPGRGIEPVVDRGVIKSAGETVLGADDKAAVAQIIEALTTLVEGGHPHGAIVAIFTVAEERGLVGSKAMDLSSVAADACFVLDSHGDVGAATTAAPWQNTIRARIHGKAAHAGVEPEAGIDAIGAAARAIAKMKLGRIDSETTANVGRIEGGRWTNLIADLVELAGEARSHDHAKLQAQTQSMVDALVGAEEEGCRVEVEVIDEYHGFALDRGHPLVRLFERACARIGIQPVLATSGGGSDANIFNDARLPALVLSTGMEQMHTTDEYVRVDQLVAGHDLILALIAEAAG